MLFPSLLGISYEKFYTLYCHIMYTFVIQSDFVVFCFFTVSYSEKIENVVVNLSKTPKRRYGNFDKSMVGRVRADE